MQKNEAGRLPHIVHKNYSKWVIDPNVQGEAIKPLEADIRLFLYDLGQSMVSWT